MLVLLGSACVGPVVADAGAADAGALDAGQLDAGTVAPDAGRVALLPDGGSTSRYWDGGACAVKTDCPCFSSDDCGPGFTCHSEDATGVNVFCVAGPRGDAGVGAPCTVEADCQSALCTDSSAGQRCSALCTTASDCPSSLPKCTYVGFGVERSVCGP
jgi:hypothetical protein